MISLLLLPLLLQLSYERILVSVNTKYPITLSLDGEPFLKLRKEEVYLIGDQKVIEMGDAYERFFWERSNCELERIKEGLRSAGPTKGALDVLIHSIDRIITQRKFLQDNQEFRKALIPE